MLNVSIRRAHTRRERALTFDSNIYTHVCGADTQKLLNKSNKTHFIVFAPMNNIFGCCHLSIRGPT